MERPIFNKNIVLPSEIDLKNIETGAKDILTDDCLFDYDEDQARQEHKHIDGIINDLRKKGMYL
jgi:hypothetical protein